MAKISFDGGPTVDGTGMKDIKATTPGDSVQGDAPAKVPGAESKSGKHIDMTGPNAP